jgi:hypothetical protein
VAIEPSAEDIAVTGCTFELASTNTAEQTHAVATTGVCSNDGCKPTGNVSIQRNTFRWRRTGTDRVGDSVKLFGNTAPTPATETDPGEPGTEVYRVRVVDNDFAACGRSCVTLQRGVNGVVIANNTMFCDGDQCVDFEPTGGGWATDVSVVSNTMVSSPDAQGEFAVAISSAKGVSLIANQMDRGVAVYRTEDVVIKGNKIRHKARGNAPTIDVANACDGLVIQGNPIQRTGAAGPVIKLEPHSGAICNGFAVQGNPITQGTAHVAIMAVSTSRASISSNVITHTVAAPALPSIYVYSVMAAAPITALGIKLNEIYGPTTYAITLEGSPGSFGQGISLIGNTAVGPTTGLRAKNPTYFMAPLTIGGNAIGPGAYSGVSFNAGN